MKIDRSNYEIWFIDWLDGNLSNIHIEQLNLFLAENPDLREELNEMADLRIDPPATQFMGKNSIKKVPLDISDVQFEYLCAAYIENDLSKDKMDVLSEIISSDQARSKILEMFGNLKLSPYNTSFKNKNKLLRRTALQKVIRLSVGGLSAAASVAVLVVSYLMISDIDSDNLSQLIMNEGRAIHSTIPLHIEEVELYVADHSAEISIETTEVFVNKITIKPNKLDKAETAIAESPAEIRYSDIIHPVEVPHNSEIAVLYQTDAYNSDLIQLTFEDQIHPDERWAAGKFFAKVFREKILKENTTDDSPIRGYEIAEAGVTGLNKLMGWEMAFVKNIDENGDLKSIYFSSKILKIQAPVNKAENR